MKTTKHPIRTAKGDSRRREKPTRGAKDNTQSKGIAPLNVEIGEAALPALSR
jgi:hypothetical protein